MTVWRPLHRGLNAETLAFMADQKAEGVAPVPVHVMLVDDSTGRSRTACAGGLGEWVTGDMTQVTCERCIEQVPSYELVTDD